MRRGNAFYSEKIARWLRARQRAAEEGKFSKRGRELSEREIEVLELIADGFSNRAMATKLAISIKTVEKHRQAAMHKLDIHEVAGLTRYAISRGIGQRAVPSGA